eukprot:scaffold144716_cov61-Attheya_sp.AAC.2
MSLQNGLLETAAGEMTISMKTKWFDALLRQDLAYYDIKDVSGTASIITSNGAKYRRGVGRKLGEGVQFTVTAIGGAGYAFYASWKTSLVILAIVPVMAASTLFLIKATQSQTSRANKSYGEAGSIAYYAVSDVRTVFSLNACRTMVDKFCAATERAFRATTSQLVWIGLGNGAVMGSFILSYLALTLFGAYLLYDAVSDTGCDPSGSVEGADTCSVSGMDVFGALLGISFAGMGIPQVSNALEAFTGARAASYPAIVSMNRKIESETDAAPESSVANGNSVHIPLPPYLIDSSSDSGLKPQTTEGVIEFRDVSFTYPSRPDSTIFKNFSLKIEAGKTVALVGPSGSGKSSVIQLIERFYDPSYGSVLLDGTDIRDLNVKWLREQVGLVSQEPALFARSIKENIAYGCPGVTDEQIVAAATMANAHNFISSFSKGYDTQVGDKGSQMSGGQKQRIAIARILIKNPKILLLDEATSALDSESESIVQQALDDLLESGNRTTIVVAHRLSTVRNADSIAVVSDGQVVEQGNHDELMDLKGHYYKLVQAQTGPHTNVDGSLRQSSVYAGAASSVIESPQVVLRNVNFSYPSRPDNVIFAGLNISVREGETLALVGPSGGGKSTVIQLLERFYDPDSGTVEFEGTNIKELNVQWYRDNLALVSQEPSLFNTTIAENIRFGYPEATLEDIVDAALQANAHNFITSFPEGYDTLVGERGTQVSGGQKQRIAIARAVLRKPKILLLDEATSALDSESEKIVQEALDRLMASKSQTTIVIAHRLSTIRDADRIAVISDGKVKEIGTHDELMAKQNGKYRRLQEFQTHGSIIGGDSGSKLSADASNKKSSEPEKDDKEIEDSVSVTNDTDDEKEFSRKARALARPDLKFIIIGSIGAILAGLIVFADMIELLYMPVYPCDDIDGPPPPSPYTDCSDYIDSTVDDIRTLSYEVTAKWAVIIGFTMLGNTLLFYGFGTASERMNKRVRDSSFESLIRQEISYFDEHTVGFITTQLQDDAALLQAFSALTIATIPFMGFGAEMEMKMYMGEDEVTEKDDEGSPGGICIETLLNIRTVASLTIEKMRSKEYGSALRAAEPNPMRNNFIKGSAAGLGQFVQMWGMALMFWWGGWLLINYRGGGFFSSRDLYISLFALLFSLSGMGVAAQGATNRDKAKAAAKRIFHLIDRESKIDSLSEEGKKETDGTERKC